MKIKKERSPLVSVIIPAYNAEKYIKKCVNSVLNQNYHHLEIVIVDDGSFDSTFDIIANLAKHDSRIIVVKQDNRGVAAARNHAISLAQGDFIAPIDSDDIWYPQKIEEQIKIFQNSISSVGVVYCWSVSIDSNDNIVDYPSYRNLTLFNSVEGNILPYIAYKNFLGNASTPLIKRECFTKVGFYDEELFTYSAQGCEDWDIYLRLAQCYEFKVVPRLLVGYRQHSSSMTHQIQTMLKSFKIIKAKAAAEYPHIPIYLFEWAISDMCAYLAGKAASLNNHGLAISLLLEAFIHDNSRLLEPQSIRVLAAWIIKLTLKPLFGYFPYSTIRNFIFNKNNQNPMEPGSTDQNREIENIDDVLTCFQTKKQFSSTYDKIVVKRWLNIREKLERDLIQV